MADEQKAPEAPKTEAPKQEVKQEVKQEAPAEKSADTNPAPKENLDAAPKEDLKPVQDSARGVGLHNR